MPKELTKVFIKDLSCDPLNSKSNLFAQIMERASTWSEKANQAGADSPLAHAIKDAASLLLKNNTPEIDGFHFDLRMIEEVGKNLETQNPAIKGEFSNIVSGITNFYSNIMNALPDSPEFKDLNLKAKNISHEMHTIAHKVETWSRTASDVVGTIAKLPFPKEIKNFLQDVEKTVLKPAEVVTQLGSVMDTLWKNTENAVKLADTLSDKAKLLRVVPAGETSAQKILREGELKAIESELFRQKPAIQNGLSVIKGGFQAAGVIASVFGKSELANDIATVGEAAVEIAGSVATLIAGSAAGGPAMPVIAIVGTVAMLISNLFGGGDKQREDLILKSIDRLSKHMDERFDRIELIIQKSVMYLAEHIDRRFMDLGNHIDKRFDRIEDTLQYMYKDMLTQFAKLHEHQADHLQTIQLKLDGIKQAIDYLHTEMSESMTDLYEQSYKDQKEQALTPIARELITAETHRNCYRSIVTWAKEKVKSDTLSGNDQTNNLVERVKASGINSYVNKIRSRAIQLGHGITDPGRLVNPAAWAEGVRTLIAYFAMTPELYNYIKPHSVLLNDIRAINSEGVRVRDFVRTIQKNSKLFENLINQYRNTLLEVIYKANDICITPDTAHPIGTASSSADRALMRVTAIEVSDTFINREIYPAGIARPVNFNLAVQQAGPDSSRTPNGDVNNDYYSKFVRQNIGKGFYEGLQRHNGSNADLVNHDIINGWQKKGLQGYRDSGGHCMWLDGPINQHIYIVKDEMHRLYNLHSASYNEAVSLRHSANNYITFLQGSHDLDLATNPTYRNERISAILSHHAVQEKDRAKNASDLPHYALIKKYFSIKDKSALNTALNANQTFTICLDNLQKAYEELSIFIGFAFPRQFAEDPHLRVFLDRLLDKQDILDYIAPGVTKPDFITIALQNILEPQGELDAFKNFLLTYVADAKLAIENSKENNPYDHPLIDKVLHELRSFQKTVTLATNVPSPVNAVNRIYHPLGSYEDTAANVDSMFKALSYQITLITGVKCEFADLKKKTNTIDEANILESLAKTENLEIIVIDESTQATQIKALNLGGQHTVHLLYMGGNSWCPFYPSEALTKRADYLAARLLTAPSNSISELEELRNQVNTLQKLIESLAVQNVAVASNEETPSAATMFSNTQSFWSSRTNLKPAPRSMNDHSAKNGSVDTKSPSMEGKP